MMTNYHQKSLPNTKFCFFQFSGNYRGHFPEFTVRKSTGIPEFRYSGINPYFIPSPFFRSRGVEMGLTLHLLGELKWKSSFVFQTTHRVFKEKKAPTAVYIESSKDQH